MAGLTNRARIGVARGTGELVIALAGELDLASIAALEGDVDALLRGSPQPARFDLGELSFMDSSGLTLLLRLANHFQPATLHDVSPLLRRTIEALGLSRHLRLDAASTTQSRSFPRTASSVPEARAYLAAALQDRRGQGTETAALLLSELATNAVLHGDGDRFEVGIRFDAGHRGIRVAVSDEGDGTPLRQRPDADDEHGRGLQLVSLLSTSWGVDTVPGAPTKTVWFEVDLGG